MTMLPLRYDGDGAFSAPPGFAKRADRDLVAGEILRWEVVGDRSAVSHRHFFAVIAAAWATLPEHLAMDFPSPEHLRKHALIKAGYCTMTRVVCATNSEAVAVAALVKDADAYAICEVSGRAVTVWRATSQSRKAMGAKAFQKSKDDVLAVISQIIGADAARASEAA